MTARLAVMDQQGIEETIMLPTLGVGMETALEHDPEALMAAFPSFNRWLARGLGLQLPGPHLRGAVHRARSTPSGPSSELEFALEHDARVVLMRPGPVVVPGGRTPGDPATTRSGRG